MRILLALALVAGCAGDSTDPGNKPYCTMALYDNCTTEHDCMSNDCHVFNADNFSACVQPCSAATPCPDQDGVPVACNAMGICKPAAARDCRVMP
jgi:hypothetical protein